MASCPRHRCAAFALALLSAIVLSACGGDARREITDVHELEHSQELPPPMSTPERLGLAAPAAQHEAPDTKPADTTSGFDPNAVTWDAPEGWTRAPDRAMRLVTFNAGPEDRCECYIAVLRGAAGGVGANINRWRAQMGQEPLDAEAVAALPRMQVLGQQAPFVEVHGPYEGMFGDSLPDAVLLGVICALDDGTLFVKMIGPADAMAEQREAFVAFCQSLRQ